EIILATKVGNRFEEGKKGWSWDPSKKYIKSAVKDSLRRLQTDYIDLYQLHGGTIDDPIDETIEAFEELKQEGIIRYYGISSIRPNVIREYVQKSNIVSVMMQHSLLDRRPEESVLELLAENNIDYIDLYQLHGGTIDDPIDETIEAFEELKQEGIIRYYGISSIRPNVIREYVQKSNIVSVMMQHSLLDRRPEESVLELLAENN